MDSSATVRELLSPQNPVLRSFAFWAGFLIVKMGLMSFLTSFQARYTRVSWSVYW